MSRGLLYHGRTDIVDGGPPKWIGQEPDTEASEKELIRELLYVFQVCTNPLYKNQKLMISTITVELNYIFSVNFNRNLAN